MLLDAILVMPESRLKPREGSMSDGRGLAGDPSIPAGALHSEPAHVSQAGSLSKAAAVFPGKKDLSNAHQERRMRQHD